MPTDKMALIGAKFYCNCSSEELGYGVYYFSRARKVNFKFAVSKDGSASYLVFEDGEIRSYITTKNVIETMTANAWAETTPWPWCKRKKVIG